MTGGGGPDASRTGSLRRLAFRLTAVCISLVGLELASALGLLLTGAPLRTSKRAP